MCHQSTGEAAVRYTADVVSLHRRLSFRGLSAQLGPDQVLHREHRGDGLVTLAVPTRHLPHRYLLGLQGFRLSQYLQLGWICEETVYSGALFSEPAHGASPDDVHVICLSGDGAIQGYLCLTACGDGGGSWDLHDPDRPAFPVEEAHDINLFDHVEALPGVRTDGVRELKRFVHARTLTDKQQRLRVTLELLYGMGRVLQGVTPSVRTLVGDLEEHVALRHLLLAGLDVQLVEGTSPGLAERDLLHHMYLARASVKPFVAHLPAEEVVEERIALLEQALASEDLFAGTSVMSRSRGTLHRVAG